jgi:hypothetical protein
MKVQFTTRIEADLMEKLKTIAEKERRSLNNLVELFLANAIEVYVRENVVIGLQVGES